MCARWGAHRVSWFLSFMVLPRSAPSGRVEPAGGASLAERKPKTSTFLLLCYNSGLWEPLGGMDLHRRSAEETIRQFLTIWASGDVEASASFIADDCVYALYISSEALPFAGETVGKANIVGALHLMRVQFDYLLFRPHHYVSEGDTVRLRVEHMYRHRASGEVLSGNFRLVFEVRDGLIARADEYHDRAMVEAFIRLVSGAGGASS